MQSRCNSPSTIDTVGIEGLAGAGVIRRAFFFSDSTGIGGFEGLPGRSCSAGPPSLQTGGSAFKLATGLVSDSAGSQSSAGKVRVTIFTSKISFGFLL